MESGLWRIKETLSEHSTVFLVYLLFTLLVIRDGNNSLVVGYQACDVCTMYVLNTKNLQKASIYRATSNR